MSKDRGGNRDAQQWHPIEDIRSLAESMSRSFDPAPNGARGGRSLSTYRAADQKFMLAENNREFVVKLELPEVHKKDLHINVSENAVTIFARWTKESRSKAKDGTQRLKSAEELYSRTIQLPAAVKADQARASFRDRVLKIFLPRAKPSQVRRIDVQ